jgi:hypothetical protein
MTGRFYVVVNTVLPQLMGDFPFNDITGIETIENLMTKNNSKVCKKFSQVGKFYEEIKN